MWSHSLVDFFLLTHSLTVVLSMNSKKNNIIQRPIWQEYKSPMAISVVFRRQSLRVTVHCSVPSILTPDNLDTSLPAIFFLEAHLGV